MNPFRVLLVLQELREVKFRVELQSRISFWNVGDPVLKINLGEPYCKRVYGSDTLIIKNYRSRGCMVPILGFILVPKKTSTFDSAFSEWQEHPVLMLKKNENRHLQLARHSSGQVRKEPSCERAPSIPKP